MRTPDFFNILKRKESTSSSSSNTAATKKKAKAHDMSSSESSSPLIISFYDPNIKAKDRCGRTQEDILSWNNTMLERSHNYIQMLFPLPEGSRFNWDVPVIDSEVMDAFRSRSELQHGLLESFERMLTFYGFESTYDTEEPMEPEEEKNTDLDCVCASTAVDDDDAGDAARPENVPFGGSDSSSEPPTDAASKELDLPSGAYKVIRGPNFNRFSRNWAVPRDHNHLRITRILRCLRVLGLQQQCDAFYLALKDVFDDPSIRIHESSMIYWTRAVQRPLYIAPNDEECDWLRKWEKDQKA